MPVFTALAAALPAIFPTAAAAFTGSVGIASTVAGLVGQADSSRKARNSSVAQTADTLASQQKMTDKTIAAEAELNKPMPSAPAGPSASGEGGDAKRKQEAQRLVASKYAGRGRSSTVMSDALG